MKKYVLMSLVAMLSLSCNSQTEKSKKHKVAEQDQKEESSAPKGSWQVNKEFDENGNLTRFDSIYSWSSSGNLKGVNNDSIFNKMQSMMQKRFSILQSPSINSFVEKDSIMKQFFSDDFFKDDFFSNSAPLGIPNMNDMMKQMEAMRQQFFSDNNRYLIPPEKKDNNKNRSKIIEKKQV